MRTSRIFGSDRRAAFFLLGFLLDPVHLPRAYPVVLHVPPPNYF